VNEELETILKPAPRFVLRYGLNIVLKLLSPTEQKIKGYFRTYDQINGQKEHKL
jgi:hypothetical protein